MSSDRFQIVINPLYNAVCKICGVDYAHRTLIETGLDSDFCNKPHYIQDADGTCEYGYVHVVDITQQGAVYICEQCAIAMAQVVGSMPPNVGRELEEENGRLINYVQELEKENLGMKGVIDGYRRIASVNLPHSMERDIILSSVPETNSEGNSIEDSIRSGASEDGTFRTSLGNQETDEHYNDDGDSTESDNVQSVNERESGKNGNKPDDQSEPKTYDAVLP